MAVNETELGQLPSDWNLYLLGDITDPNRPISYGIVQTGKPVTNGIQCLRVIDLENGKILHKDLITTSKSISDGYKRTILRDGDLVTPLRGKVGEVAIIDESLQGANITRGLALIALKHEYSARFLRQTLSSKKVRNRLQQSMNGSALQEIPIATLRNFSIALPPTLAEQEAIAGALSDADAWIDSLEQLIAKKRQIKQGAMQELLTGQKRLPGFTVAWETKCMGELATIRDGTHQTPKYVQSGVPFYSVEHVTSGDFTNTKFISLEEHRFLTRSFKMEKGDILMTRIGSIGDCKLIDWEVDASFYVSLALLKIRAGYSAAFIAHYSNTAAFKTEVELHSLQSAIPKKINLGPISHVQIVLPPTETEQTAIAAILSDMDAEIAGLEAKLAKARQVKQGMMQELLTGRIRLV